MIPQNSSSMSAAHDQTAEQGFIKQWRMRNHQTTSVWKKHYETIQGVMLQPLTCPRYMNDLLIYLLMHPFI